SALAAEPRVHVLPARLERRRQMGAELAEELVVRAQLFLPRRHVDARKLPVLAARELLEPGPVQILEARHDAERRFHAAGATLAALDDPAQHAHVLAEPGPYEAAVRVAPEPVDAEDARRMPHGASHLQPVPEVVAHVVAAEGEHRHR